MSNQTAIRRSIYTILILFAIFIIMPTSPTHIWIDNLDTQIYITVARCMNAGKLLYKDIVDQKGPLLFIGLAALEKLPIPISLSIWLTEILSAATFAIVQYKIISLCTTDKHNIEKYVFMTVLCYLYSSLVYVGSGLCTEEYSLPLLSCQLYITMKNQNKKLTKKDCFLFGLTTSIMFFVKYAALVATIIFGITILIQYIRKKENTTTYISTLVWGLTGFIPATAICLLYLLPNDLFSDFIQTYFKDNMIGYGLPPLKKWSTFLSVVFFASPLFILSVTCIMNKARQSMTIVIQLIATMIITLLISPGYGTYYVIIYAFTGALTVYGVEGSKHKKYQIITILSIALLSIPCVTASAYRITKQKCAQKEIANIIMQYDDQSINTIGGLDTGVYYALDCIPDYKYPYALASDTQENIQSQIQCVNNRETNFIVSDADLFEKTENPPKTRPWFKDMDITGYELIFQPTIKDGYNYDLWLYKRKDTP